MSDLHALTRPLSSLTFHVARREWRAHKKSMLLWAIAPALLQAMTLSMQPEMAKEGSLFEQKLAMMPKEMIQGFGLVTKNLSDPAWFMGTNFTIVLLIGAVFAALVGASLVAREESEGTAESLFALPVPRAVVVVGKVLAGVLLVVGLDVIVGAVAFATYAAIGVSLASSALIVAQLVAATLLHLAILGLALLASTLLRAPRAASSTGMGLALALYGVHSVGAMKVELAGLAKLSPFHYARPIAILEAGGLPADVVVLPLLFVVAVALALVRVERKDLHA